MCVRAAVYTLCHSGGGFVQGLSPPPHSAATQDGITLTGIHSQQRARETLLFYTVLSLSPRGNALVHFHRHGIREREGRERKAFLFFSWEWRERLFFFNACL